MDKSLIHFSIHFPTKNQTPVMPDPGHCAFDFPSIFIAPKSAAILNWLFPTLSWRGNEFNTGASKFGTQKFGIVTFITNQTLGLPRQAFERCLNQRLLVRCGRVKGHCQRNSFAVRHHHELRTLATPSDFDFRAPFLAITKWPSIKHCAHWIRRRLSSSRIKLSQIFSQIPWSSQSLKRLQQVLGLGYCFGKSFQRAPLRSTHRMPSRTSRFFFQGRPLLLNFGSKGSIFSHCFWLKYIARLIGSGPPMSLLSSISYNDL